MTETAQGLSRPLTKWEYAFWLLDHASCTNHAVIAEISREVDEEKLRRGLEGARSRHPMLLSRIVVGKGKKVVFEPDKSLEPIQIKVVESEKWKVEIAVQMDVPFTSEDCPLFRAFLFRHGGSSHFAMVFHHSIADATAAISLIGEVLTDALGHSEVEREFKQPLPEMEKLFPKHEHVKGISKIAKVARFGLALVKDRLGEAPLKLPHFKDASFAMRHLDVLPVSVGATLSEEIIKRSKKEGTTVHGALSAGLIFALKGFYPSRYNDSFSIISPVGLRNRLSEAVPSDEMGNYIGHLIVLRESGRDFWGLAKSVSNEMHERIEKGEAHAVCTAAPSSRFCPPTERGVRKFNKLMFLHPHSQMLSNVGKIDDIIKGDIPGVENIFSLMSPHTRDGVSLCVSSYKESLTINLVYATAALPAEMPHKLITRFEQALRKACP